MSSVNKVILVGRLGKDPETRTFDNGTAVCNFSMATSETWKDKVTGQKKETTEWHNIVLWRGLAEIAQKYLHKGDLIYIEGKMKTRMWEKDGVKRYITEVYGENMTMLSTKGTSKDSRNSDPGPQEPGGYSGGQNVDGNVSVRGEDDLPF